MASSRNATPETFGILALLALYVALWAVTWRYWGLRHDAQAYAAQALAKTDHGVLDGDLFLRFQSQDDFTLFPYFCAQVIIWLGLDHAAALITLLLFIAWMTTAWYLARALVGARQAWLSIGLLLTIPGWYGAGMVFRTAEPFLSARPAAEVACMLSLLLLVNGHRLAAATLVALAAALHPIMAFPAALAFVAFCTPWHESRRFWPLAAISCVAGCIAGSFVLGGDTALMSDEWLEATRSRSNFLFPRYWLTSDWQTNALPLLSVLISAQYLDGWARKLATAAFWIGASGLALAVFADMVQPLKLLLQGQPWRWLWLGGVIALMLLPVTLAAAWQRAPSGRVVALLMGTAWLMAHWSSADAVPPIGASGLMLCAAVLVWLFSSHLRPQVVRGLAASATSGLALAILGLVMSAAAIVQGRFDFGTDPLWVQVIADVLTMPAAAALVAGAGWWLTIRSWQPARSALVGICGALLAISAAPGAASTWFTESYARSARSVFDEWRTLIPKDAEVLWYDGLQQTWFLLGRRSYLTISQLGGIVFSEELAWEARRRAEILTPLVPAGYWFIESSVSSAKPRPMTVERLMQICRHGGPDFVVDDESFGSQIAEAELPSTADRRYLYDCRTTTADSAATH